MKFLTHSLLSFLFIVISVLVAPHLINAQEEIPNEIQIVKAKVLSAINGEGIILPGTNQKSKIQTLEAEIIEGDGSGKVVTFENDYVMLESGDTFYLSSNLQPDDSVIYAVFEPDRIPVLFFFLILFVILVLVFGGIQGFRGLLSLAGSLFVIVFALLPGIIAGFPPLLVSVVVSSIIIIIGSYVTHGFNRTTSSAVVGMIVTVVGTGIMAHFAVYGSNLTGVSGDEAFYLNLNTGGNIDLIGLLMGGIMIGLLGVLYDVSIGQSVSVEELHTVAPHISKWEIYKRTIRIGREHIGALVNTLAIAYVGASLPLLLLFYSSADSNLLMIVNREVFATEIIRILIGSIGLVLAVPITTLLAVLMLIKNQNKNLPNRIIKEEEKALENFEHKH